MINFNPVDFLLRVLETKGEPPGSMKPPAVVAPAASVSALSGRPVRPRNAQSHTAEAATGHAAPSKRDGDAVADTAAERADDSAQTSAPKRTDGTPSSAATADPDTKNAALSLRLSAVARLLGEAAAAGNGSAPTVQASAPLLPQPPLDAAELASALQRSIADSGLFYESHLAQWALQQYPPQQLQAEPQARWHHAPTTGAGVTADAASAAASKLTNVAALALPDHAAPLLRHQLQALITQQLTWHGQPWPGQSASIHIADESPAAHENIDKTWRTRLDLTLPNLGAVHATIGLTGQRLELTLQSDRGESAERLRATAQSLIAALNAHTFDIAAVRIGHGDAS